MFKFSVSALEKAPVTRRGEADAAFLDLDAADTFAPAGDVSYDLTAQLVSGGVLVSGSCSCLMHTVCGKCLKEFDFLLEAPDLHIFFELEENQEELDTADDIRAELLLELPMNPLCDPECQGLCPVCGVDRNRQHCTCNTAAAAEKVSPWSALDGLKLD